MNNRAKNDGTNRRQLTGTSIGALAILLLSCQAGPRDGMDLATLLDRHTKARGGAAAIEAVEALKVDLEIVEPGFTVTGTYVATRNGHMRIDVFAGDERVFTEALGPDGGWQMHADGIPLDLSPEGEKALERGIFHNLYGLHELSGHGFIMDLVGPAERSGRQCWEIRQVGPDGSSKTLFLDAETYLIARSMETKALHPDIDPTETRQESIPTGYSSTNGVLFANGSEKSDLDTGKVIQTTEVTALQVNATVNDSIFSRPPAPEA